MRESEAPDRVKRTELSVPQLGIGKILLMFAWPAAWFTLLIYGLGPLFIPASGPTPTWFLLAVFVLGNGAELAAGILLLQREGRPLSFAWLRSRIRLRWPRGWKPWVIALAAFLVAAAASMAAGPLNRALASVPGFIPPTWWPSASNPNVTVMSAADVFPDVHLAGNWGFVVLYLAVGFIFNIIGEELYYRGYLLPRMRGVFGRLDWIANGVLFTLKHVYQRWLFPGIIAGGLALAFAAGPLGSLPLAIVMHWLGNYLFQTVFLVRAVVGG